MVPGEQGPTMLHPDTAVVRSPAATTLQNLPLHQWSTCVAVLTSGKHCSWLITGGVVSQRRRRSLVLHVCGAAHWNVHLLPLVTQLALAGRHAEIAPLLRRAACLVGRNTVVAHTRRTHDQLHRINFVRDTTRDCADFSPIRTFPE